MSALSLALAKAHLNITVNTYDTELQTFIDSAEAIIGERCGPLVPVEKTDRTRGGCSYLVLGSTPVDSLTSVTPIGGTALDLDDLHLDGETGLVYWATTQRAFPDAWYEVVYDAGRNPVPADLLAAVKELVRHLWETQRGGTVKPGSRPPEGLSNTLPGSAYALPIRVEQLLAPHRLMVS